MSVDTKMYVYKRQTESELKLPYKLPPVVDIFPELECDIFLKVFHHKYTLIVNLVKISHNL